MLRHQQDAGTVSIKSWNCLGKTDVIEYSEISTTSFQVGLVFVELHYENGSVDIVMYLPPVVTTVLVFPLNVILYVIPLDMTINTSSTLNSIWLSTNIGSRDMHSEDLCGQEQQSLCNYLIDQLTYQGLTGSHWTMQFPMVTTEQLTYEQYINNAFIHQGQIL